MKPNRAQDWDILRVYDAISSSGAMMPYSDAEMIIDAFALTQDRVSDELGNLPKAMPDSLGVAPRLDEYGTGFDFGDEWENSVGLEQLNANTKKAWENFWLNGGKFESLFHGVLRLDLTPEHSLWDFRFAADTRLAEYTVDWDARNNLVRLNLECHSCDCSSDGSTHHCQGLDCNVAYETSFTPSRYLDEAVFTVGNFFQSHFTKHGWPCDGA